MAFTHGNKAEFDEDEEQIILYGPKYVGLWTCPQQGQAEYAGVSDEGLAKFNTLRAAAKAGRTAAGLAVEKAFLTKIRADKRITAPTYEQERASKRRKRNKGPVQAAAPMDAAQVEAQFDE